MTIPNPAKSFGLVYLITNTANGKRYVGQTIRSMEARWLSHCSKARSTNPQRRLHIAMKRYGVHLFTVECLGYAVNRQELNDLEEHYINTLNALSPTGYNVMTTAMWRTWGEYKDVALNLRLRVVTDEKKQAVSNTMRGRALTEQHKRNIAASKLGVKRSVNTGRRLTMEQARAIRLDKRSHKLVAKEYNVTHGVIACVRAGLTYKEKVN